VGAEDVVVDASAITGFLLNEKPGALGIMEACIRGGGRLLAPDLAYAEVANAVWKAHALCSLMGREEAEGVLCVLHRLPLAWVRHGEVLIGGAFRVAIEVGVTVYDSIYIALAKLERAELVTSDTRQAEAAEGIVTVRLV